MKMSILLVCGPVCVSSGLLLLCVTDPCTSYTSTHSQLRELPVSGSMAGHSIDLIWTLAGIFRFTIDKMCLSHTWEMPPTLSLCVAHTRVWLCFGIVLSPPPSNSRALPTVLRCAARVSTATGRTIAIPANRHSRRTDHSRIHHLQGPDFRLQMPSPTRVCL